MEQRLPNKQCIVADELAEATPYVTSISYLTLRTSGRIKLPASVTAHFYPNDSIQFAP